MGKFQGDKVLNDFCQYQESSDIELSNTEINNCSRICILYVIKTWTHIIWVIADQIQ